MGSLEQPSPARGFVRTRWSQVLASSGSGHDARAALAWLCERYWEPLRAHARRRGLDDADADDLTQDFFCSVLAGDIITRADPLRGRFRTFLLACLEHHLSHRQTRDHAQKRGGHRLRQGVSDDDAVSDRNVGQAFDRDWADALLARVHDRLAREASEAHERHAALMPFVTVNGDATAYAAIGAHLGLSEGAVKVSVHRLRQRFRDLLRTEVADTLDEPTPLAIDAELRELLAVLRERR